MAPTTAARSRYTPPPREMKLLLALATLFGTCDFVEAGCECRVFGRCGLSSDYTCCRGGADADPDFCPPRAQSGCATAANAFGQNPCQWVAPVVNCVETGNTAADCLDTCAVAVATVTTPASGGGTACVGDYTCVGGDGACPVAVDCVETGNTAADCLDTCAVAVATVTAPASGGGTACVGDYTCVGGDGTCVVDNGSQEDAATWLVVIIICCCFFVLVVGFVACRCKAQDKHNQVVEVKQEFTDVPSKVVP
jgi:hypothetical protein